MEIHPNDGDDSLSVNECENFPPRVSRQVTFRQLICDQHLLIT